LVIGRSCHHRRRGVSRPLGPTSPSRQLDASVEASGPHDFSVRAPITRQLTGSRPSHSAPTFVTIAIRPLIGYGTRRLLKMICPTSQAKGLRHVGTTGKSVAAREIMSSAEQLLPSSLRANSAIHIACRLIREIGSDTRVFVDHRSSSSNGQFLVAPLSRLTARVPTFNVARCSHARNAVGDSR
jgi:hypothetical protein